MNEREDIFKKSLLKMSNLRLVYIDKANEAYLKEAKEDFKKNQLAYQVIDDCISILTAEAQLQGFSIHG